MILNAAYAVAQKKEVPYTLFNSVVQAVSDLEKRLNAACAARDRHLLAKLIEEASDKPVDVKMLSQCRKVLACVSLDWFRSISFKTSSTARLASLPRWTGPVSS